MAIQFTMARFRGQGASQELRHHWLDLLSLTLQLFASISNRLCRFTRSINISQLSAMDASVRTTMKGAAKCDKHCKLQDSANQQNFERILRFREMPGSMPTSESPCIHVLGPSGWERVSVHQRALCC